MIKHQDYCQIIFMIFHELQKLEIGAEYTLSWDKCAKRKIIYFDTHYSSWLDNSGHYWTDYGFPSYNNQAKLINGDQLLLKLLLCSNIDRLTPV